MTDCIFCKIVKGEIPSKIIYQDDDLVAFHDISKKASVHFLIVPVKHLKSLQEVSGEDAVLMGKLILLVNRLTVKLGIAKDGYKVVINNGSLAGQMVFHLHLHILGGWKGKESWKV